MAQQHPPPSSSYPPEFPEGPDWLNTEKPIKLAQLKGKTVILDFWTYSCINCMHVIPQLKKLEEEFPNELVVIGIHSAKFANEGNTDNLRKIILRYGLKHPVVNDRDLLVWRSWAVRAWPTLFIVDPAGKVVGQHSGESVYYLFKPIVQSLIAEFESKKTLDRRPLALRLEKDAAGETFLSFPGRVVADTRGGRLFIADTNNHRIVIAALANGAMVGIIGSGKASFNDGDFHTACFHHPQGLALADDGRTLFVADTENHAIRAVRFVDTKVVTLAGVGFQADDYPPRGGTAPDVALNSPWDLEIDGQRLYIAMAGSHQIWMMDLESKNISPFAGSGREGTLNGRLAQAELAQPSGLAYDGQGRLYFADSEGSAVRWADVSREHGSVNLLAGSGKSLFDFGDVDGVGGSARLQHPLGLAYHDGAVYVADTYNNKIKKINAATGEVRTLVGHGPGWRDGNDPLFHEPGGIDAAADALYVADTNNHAIRKIDLVTNQTTTLTLRA